MIPACTSGMCASLVLCVASPCIVVVLRRTSVLGKPEGTVFVPLYRSAALSNTILNAQRAVCTIHEQAF